jgi:hypothetical protein
MSRKRNLTAGELTLAREMFQDSIQYERVKIHRGKYFFRQPENSGMTPNGEIYVSGEPYRKDYSAANVWLQAFFIHEMTHVWQYQNRVLHVKLSAILGQIRHLGNYGKMYEYTLDAKKKLIEYGVEQQAAIVEDYFIVVKKGLREFRGERIQNRCATTEKIEMLKNVMADFLFNPTFQ